MQKSCSRSQPVVLHAQLKRTLRAFVADESGASAVEYALLVAAIVVALYAAFRLMNLNGIFTTLGDTIRNCMNSSC